MTRATQCVAPPGRAQLRPAHILALTGFDVGNNTVLEMTKYNLYIISRLDLMLEIFPRRLAWGAAVFHDPYSV